MNNQNTHHLLLIAASAQGHINPSLQLAKRLTRASPNIRVTFATMANALGQINLPSSKPYLHQLSFATFSTGFDDGVKPTDDPQSVAEKAKRVVSTSLRDLIISLSNEGRPIDFLVYTFMLPWAADVARELHVPSALLFIQSATTFAIYNRYFNGNNGRENQSTNICIELPGLPLFESCDIPTFLLPSSPHYFAAPTVEDHLRALDRDPNPTVLINSFDALEESVMSKAFDQDHHVKIIAIGPLIPSAFSDMIDPSDTSYGCDLFERSKDYLNWLENKAEKSVIYVSFGSMTVMKRKQFEEILHGLELTGRPYLWVVRPMTHNKVLVDELDDEVVMEDVVKMGLGPVSGSSQEKGLIVPWCSQVEVLNHPTIGCFLTHCGWNSILESVVMGVPIVGIPQISDQPTNAKLVEEVWRIGVKANKNKEDIIIDRYEVRRCIEIVMGDEEIGQEIRRNSKKWMEMALEAIMEEGSSNNNLEYFIEGIQRRQQNEETIKKEGPLEGKELLLEDGNDII